MKLEVTKQQLSAMIDLRDTISAMMGTGQDFDDEAKRNIRLFDRMLKKNGLKSNLN